jgi:hypothetical protein
MKNAARLDAIEVITHLLLLKKSEQQLRELVKGLTAEPIPFLPTAQQPPLRTKKHNRPTTETNNHAS